MHRPHILAVVNPRSGLRRGQHNLNQLHSILQQAGCQLTVITTSGPGHATQIAADSELQHFHCIAVIGGDGTIHEVVNGLMLRHAPAQTPIAIVPAGTGNALALQYNLQSVPDAAHRILRGTTTPLDVLQVTQQQQTTCCINIAGWGAATDINVTAEKLRWLGRSRYSLAALLQILQPPVRSAIVTLDQQTLHGQFLFAVACNTRFAGHRMLLAPDARCDDGLLDVLLLRPTSRWNLLKVFQGIADGSHRNLPGIEYHQARSVTIQTSDPDPLNLDGEISGTAPFTATVLPAALRLLV
ncbi:MAG: diacylglycerol/lipid kinase family protein [Planctomycetaceae bacterium]